MDLRYRRVKGNLDLLGDGLTWPPETACWTAFLRADDDDVAQLRMLEITATMDGCAPRHAIGFAGVWVAPEHRGRGHGRELVRRAAWDVRVIAPADPIALWAHPELARVYESSGFRAHQPPADDGVQLFVNAGAGARWHRAWTTLPTRF